jgi:hypothetical protein
MASDDIATDATLARFGEPEVIYRPSGGQTTLGILLAVVLVGMGVAVAVLGEQLGPWNRYAAGGVAVTGLVFAFWVYRLRRWRLAIGPNGLVQIRAWRVDAVPWADVHEAVETRYGDETGRVSRIRLHGRFGRVTVAPVNLRAHQELFRKLREAIEARDIRIGVEVETGD